MDELSGIDIRHLRYFATVAEAGTVTEAARRLRIAQPSLSQQIRALERRVGTSLFHRRPQGMELTDSGTALLQGVQHAFDALQSALAAARGTPRPVRLGACRGAPAEALTRAETLVTDAGPGPVTIEQIDSEEQVRQLRSGTLDLGLLRLPADRTGLSLHLLSDEPLGVVLDADHPLARLPALTGNDLAGRRLLWFPAHRAPGYSAAVLDRLADDGWRPELVTDASAGHTLFRHALRAHHDMVALRPKSALSEGDGLTWRPYGPRPPYERIALAARRGSRFGRMVENAAELLPAAT
ncbi:LysR family transcriptional regulator [Streptomyces rimosus]|uniref:LysR family transcriptional regulator n=1 Tax=Streptomyces rimosus TaxID=1927 RepID=UPI0004CB3A19|nr:LysR family transcriptional regulator [Streptomyces rimosus]